MYAEINGDFLDKTRLKALERAKQQYGVDPKQGMTKNVQKDLCVWTHKELEDTWDYDIDMEHNWFIVKIKNPLGYFEIITPYDLDFEIKVLEHASKQVNKMKAALQSMK